MPMPIFFKNKNIIFLSILFLFLVTRLSGLHLPYHQDERKYATSVSVSDSNTPHPPISKAIMVSTAKIFGRDNFRVTPFLFSIANLLLLYYFVRFKYGIQAALWAVFLFAVSYYSVLASLMVDIDGAILPFFLLLSLIGYYKWQDAHGRKAKITWGMALVVALILGFLTKLSFIIVVGALILDYLSQVLGAGNKKALFRYGVAAVGLLVFLGLILWGARAIFPSFNLARTLSHAQDYFHLTGRAYLQVLIQSVKAVLYLSPLMILPLIFLTKERLAKLRLFFIFIFLGLIFYLVIFDFSRAALDKYLTFLILPLAVISGVIFNEIFGQEGRRGMHPGLLIGLAFVIIIFFSQFLQHFIPPLYPKEEWMGRIIKFKWNFVFPFTGGSGPVGFYVSWLFIGLSWIASAIFAILALIKKQQRSYFLTMVLALGFIYNLVFAEEYLFGRINGSPGVLLKNAVNFIEKNEKIKRVISYNDIGGYEIAKIGKYERRLYAAPKFESSYIDILENFKGHYLVIDIPQFNPDSVYVNFFKTCKVIYNDADKQISARVYDCKNSKSSYPL